MKEQKERKALSTQDEVYKLVKENNRMLKKMRRDAFVGGILKFVWWVLILFVIPYFLYTTYLQPQIEALTAAYQNVENTTNSVNARLEGIPDFGSLLEQFGVGGE